MKYLTGMYGGSFDPLHQGHVVTMLRAASVCEKLYIVLSYSRSRDRIPMEYRYRWINQILAHLSHVSILLLEDTAESKAAYATEDLWQQGANEIRKQIGAPVDVVFCGSDYQGTGRYESLYPEAKIIYVNREQTQESSDVIPVSSTKIHENPFRYWEYLPEVVRPWYVKKILLVGGESTGKSTLTRNLALTFQTVCVEEAGREICARAGCEDTMVAEDLYQCVLYQKTAIWEQTRKANRLLFVDTDALTTKFYMQFLLQETIEQKQALALADAVDAIQTFDLIFFLEPDVNFIQDGTRNEKIRQERESYSDQLKQLFLEKGKELVCLTGDYEARYLAAVAKIKEKWSWQI